MTHPIYRVIDFQILGEHILRVFFDDKTSQTINFRPVLAGAIYGPLRDVALFEKAIIDPEVHTLVWPNGADFDPATLHDWPRHLDELKRMAERWADTSVPARHAAQGE